MIAAKITEYPGLYPVFLDTNTGDFQGDWYKLGSYADSFYEYLLKQWLLDDKTKPRFRRMYDESAKVITLSKIDVISQALGTSPTFITCFF